MHLCWQTVEQQFIPALAIASAVGAKFGNHGKLQNISLLRLFYSLKVSHDRKSSFPDRIPLRTILHSRLDWLGMNSRREFFA
jgi:hypothetical protein